MKSSQGFTMTQTVVAVVMIILIASFSIYNARTTLVETKIIRTYDEMVEVKSAVKGLTIFDDDKLNGYLGTPIEVSGDYTYINVADDSKIHKYYLLDFKTNGEQLCDILELKNIENNYIADIGDLESIELYLVGGVNINEKKCYTISEIEKEYNSVYAGRE